MFGMVKSLIKAQNNELWFWGYILCILCAFITTVLLALIYVDWIEKNPDYLILRQLNHISKYDVNTNEDINKLIKQLKLDDFNLQFLINFSRIKFFNYLGVAVRYLIDRIFLSFIVGAIGFWQLREHWNEVKHMYHAFLNIVAEIPSYFQTIILIGIVFGFPFLIIYFGRKFLNLLFCIAIFVLCELNYVEQLLKKLMINEEFTGINLVKIVFLLQISYFLFRLRWFLISFLNRERKKVSLTKRDLEKKRSEKLINDLSILNEEFFSIEDGFKP